jgi:2-aminoadipate transaminase
LGRKSKGKTRKKRPRTVAPEKLTIDVSSASDRPLFAQIREQIRDYVISGTLLPGMRLPPVRRLAEQISVSQLTVAKAYRELAESNLIEGRRGGGSFVRSHQPPPSSDFLADAGRGPLLAERLYELSRAPGVISFSSNYPTLDKVAIDAFRSSLLATATDTLDNCFRYDPPLGRPALRRQIQLYLKQRGIEVDPDNVMVTSGAQQAIDRAVHALVAPGAAVTIEQPAYYGAINTLRAAGARILEVPLERDGMDLDVLERHLVRDQVRVIYTNPTFQNPMGITMSDEKRRSLLTLARHFRAVVIEDDHSHELRFRGREIPALRALAEDDDLVLYARGFGKTWLPGVRLGYLVMPDVFRQRLLAAKAHADLHCNSLVQEVVAQYLARRSYVETLKRMIATYGPRQQQLYNSLMAGMPSGALLQGGPPWRRLWRRRCVLCCLPAYPIPAHQLRCQSGRRDRGRRFAPVLRGQGSADPSQHSQPRHDVARCNNPRWSGHVAPLAPSNSGKLTAFTDRDCQRRLA